MFLFVFCCLATIAREYSYRYQGPYTEKFEEIPLFSIQRCLSSKC